MDPAKKLRIIFALAAAIVIFIIVFVVAQIVSMARRDRPNTPAPETNEETQTELPSEDEDQTSVLDWFDSFFEPDNSSSQTTPQVPYDFDPFAVPPTPAKNSEGNFGGQAAPPPEPPPAAPLPSANVISPSLAQILIIGETVPIRWSLSAEINHVRIKLYESPVAICGYDKNCASEISARTPSYVIAEGESNDSVFNWNVGTSDIAAVPAGKYYVRIETIDGDVLGNGQTFAVVSPGMSSSIDLAIPYDIHSFSYEAEPMAYFTKFDIPQGVLWNASPGILYVDIFIKSKSDQQIFQIAKHVPNGNLFGWKPGKGDVNGKQIPSGEYELYVQDADDSNIKSQSRLFVLNPVDE